MVQVTGCVGVQSATHIGATVWFAAAISSSAVILRVRLDVVLVLDAGNLLTYPSDDALDLYGLWLFRPTARCRLSIGNVLVAPGPSGMTGGNCTGRVVSGRLADDALLGLDGLNGGRGMPPCVVRWHVGPYRLWWGIASTDLWFRHIQSHDPLASLSCLAHGDPLPLGSAHSAPKITKASPAEAGWNNSGE